MLCGGCPVFHGGGVNPNQKTNAVLYYYYDQHLTSSRTTSESVQHLTTTFDKNIWRHHSTTTFDNNIWQQHLTTSDNIWRHHLTTTSDNNIWRQHLTTSDNILWLSPLRKEHFLSSIARDSANLSFPSWICSSSSFSPLKISCLLSYIVLL